MSPGALALVGDDNAYIRISGPIPVETLPRIADLQMKRVKRQVRNGRWKGTVRFIADATIEALAFAPRAGVLSAGDDSGPIHFLKVELVPK